MDENRKLTHILDNYYMDADENQYILYYEKTSTNRKTGEQYKSLSVIGYYGTIPTLLQRCITHSNRQDMQDGKFDELNDCIKQIMSKTDEFMSLMSELKLK